MQNDALFGALGTLLGSRRHGVDGLETGHVHARGAQAHGGAGAVVGHVAATQHDHVARGVHGLAVAGGFEEIGVDVDAVEVAPGHTQTNARMGADRHEDRVVPLSEQPNGIAHALGAPDLDTRLGVSRLRGLEDRSDLAVDHGIGQAVGRDTVAHLAASLLVGLEHRDGMTLLSQELRSGQAGGTGSHHGYLLAGERLVTYEFFPRTVVAHGCRALEAAHRHGRLVELVVLAGRLAVVGADGAQSLGEGHLLAHDGGCLAPLALADAA